MTNVPFDFPIKIQIPINVTKVKLSIVETIAIMINFNERSAKLNKRWVKTT